MEIQLDRFGFIKKIVNNERNTDSVMNLNSLKQIVDKLDFYRGLIGRTHDLSKGDFDDLKLNIATFFNLKPVSNPISPPELLFRISNNNRLFEYKAQELSYLTEIKDILAPPEEYCGFGRCNIPRQQILYCGFSIASAYWETKPKDGDVITISTFKLKDGVSLNCSIIKNEKDVDDEQTHILQKVYSLLDDFFIDVFTMEVDRSRPKDYLFSAILAAELFSFNSTYICDIEAIMYPSVQRKKKGGNLAIRNELIFQKYDLASVETRFILDQFDDPNPIEEKETTDSIIGSFYSTTFDFDVGKILYSDKADEIFELFRRLQTNGSKQVRVTHGPEIPNNLAFNLSRIQ